LKGFTNTTNDRAPNGHFRGTFFVSGNFSAMPRVATPAQAGPGLAFPSQRQFTKRMARNGASNADAALVSGFIP
jgi:hypothetical protein